MNTMLASDIVQRIMSAPTMTFDSQLRSIKSYRTLSSRFLKENKNMVLILFGVVAKRSTKTYISINHCMCDLRDPVFGFIAPQISVHILAWKHSNVNIFGSGHPLGLNPGKGISSNLL